MDKISKRFQLFFKNVSIFVYILLDTATLVNFSLGLLRSRISMGKLFSADHLMPKENALAASTLELFGAC